MIKAVWIIRIIFKMNKWILVVIIFVYIKLPRSNPDISQPVFINWGHCAIQYISKLCFFISSYIFKMYIVYTATACTNPKTVVSI